MPVIGFNSIKGETVDGKELYDDGIKEVDGKPVDPSLKYRKKIVVQKTLNHYRKMKKMYNQHGMGGANAYAIAVNNYIQKNKNEAKETDKT